MRLLSLAGPLSLLLFVKPYKDAHLHVHGGHCHSHVCVGVCVCV